MAQNGDANASPLPEASPPRVSNGKPQAAGSGLPKGAFPGVKRNRADRLLAVTEAAKDKMCRNLYIYGYCKFEGKGCAFRHDRVLNLHGSADLIRINLKLLLRLQKSASCSM